MNKRPLEVKTFIPNNFQCIIIIAHRHSGMTYLSHQIIVHSRKA